jgi:hypothetical protein
MKWNVYYTWRGELYNGGQYDTKTEAQTRAAELIADHWNGVHIRPTEQR